MKILNKSRIPFMITAVVFMTFQLVIHQGCKNYNQEDLYPACDTVNVTYTHDMQPIFSANCLPCHTSVNQFGGIVLDNLTDARVPAQNGLLLKAVTHDPSVVPMPKGGAKLSDCDISKIRQWIALGEPEK